MKKWYAIIWILALLWLISLGACAGNSGEVDRLEGQLDASRVELKEAHSEAESLKGKVAGLRREISGLETELAEAQSRLGEAESELRELGPIAEVAESASWLTDDGRLEVTSELVPEKLFEEIVWYEVEVKVTNIGDECIDEVWIFLFPHIGEHLDPNWNPLMYVQSVENLHCGDTLSRTFSMLPADMTTYEMLAVGE